MRRCNLRLHHTLDLYHPGFSVHLNRSKQKGHRKAMESPGTGGKWLVPKRRTNEISPVQRQDASAKLTCECTALCCSRLTACPKVLPHISHAKGLVPLWDRRTCTSSPCGVENT